MLCYETSIRISCDDIRQYEPIQGNSYTIQGRKRALPARPCLLYKQQQMKNRPDNGLIDYEVQEKMKAKNSAGKPLVNEVEPDMIGKTAEKVRSKAMDLMDTVNPELDTDMKSLQKSGFNPGFLQMVSDETNKNIMFWIGLCLNPDSGFI